MSRIRVVAGGLLLSAGGCGDDLLDVNGRMVDPAPQISALEETVSGRALIFFDLSGKDGEFEETREDGSVWSGTVDRDTGAFSTYQEFPTGEYLESIEAQGYVSFNGAGDVYAADFVDWRSYADDTAEGYETVFWVEDGRVRLEATDRDRGTRVAGEITPLIDHLRIEEERKLSSVYLEEIVTTYYGESSDIALEQAWTRDDFATEVVPDRAAEFVIEKDFSGGGQLRWYFDHGIYQVYEVALNSEGGYDSTLVYEDPGTEVEPDGLGSYHFAADYSGDGVYDQSYEDGSTLHVDYEFSVLGETDSVYRFDEVQTGFAPDIDGQIHYAPFGSGYGQWTRYDADGPVESCVYDFDAAGVVTEMTCE